MPTNSDQPPAPWPQQQPNQEQPPVVAPKSSRNLWLVVGAIVAVGAIIIGLIIALTRPTEDPQSSTPRAAPDTTTSGTSLDDTFIRRVHAEGVLTGMPALDADTIRLGHNICTSLDSGMTVEDIVLSGIKSGFSGHEAGVIAGVAIATYCPEHAPN